jgi:hypothetical protein
MCVRLLSLGSARPFSLPSRIQMGRNAIFKPRVCTRADLDVFLEAERTLGGKSKVANRKTRRRVVGDFGRLIAANGFVDPVEGLRFWAGACKNDGLGWGAIDTYSAYISKVISPTLTWSQRGDWMDVRSTIRCAHADEDTHGAATCPREHIVKILPQLSLSARQAIAAITFTGARLCDLKRLRRKQMRFGKNSIQIEVRIAKNRRKRSARRILRIRNVGGLVGLTLDESLLTLQVEQQQDQDFRPLSHLCLNSINTQLRCVCQKLGLPRYTTYSFRKFFIRSVIAKFEGDWPRILNFTLHTKMDVVAAHYDGMEEEDETF